MTASSRPSQRLREAVSGAYGAAAGLSHGPPVIPMDTVHLLLGTLSTSRGSAVRRALAHLGVTPTTVMAVLRRRYHDGTGWAHDDAGTAPTADPSLDAIVTALTERRGRLRRAKRRVPGMSFTPAALRALHGALVEAMIAGSTEVDPEHLVVALLTDPASRVAELLTVFGIDREVAYRSAVEAAHTGRFDASTADGLDIDLRFTRAALLGQARYTAGTVAERLPLSLMRMLSLNWAEMPELWALLDATHHAWRSGQPTVGTDHLLLGVLATHEVAHALPHLLPTDAPQRYRGGAVLSEHGVTHTRVKQTLASAIDATTRRAGLDQPAVDALQALGIDVDQIVTQAERSFGPGALVIRGRARRTRVTRDMRRRWRVAVTPAHSSTADLVISILDREQTAARRVLAAMGCDPDDIRQQLGPVTGPPSP
jgi:ATP-dependent Clp protease ATP-binding subunit ClpA